MFGSQILDVAIGLVFIYLLLSLICTAAREGLEGWLKTRAIDLEQGIRELLNDPTGTGLTKALYAHPLVDGLYNGDYDPTKIKDGRMPIKTNLPSYIPSANFAVALLDIVARGQNIDDAAAANPRTTQQLSLEAVRASVATLNNARVQRLLLSAIDRANGDLAVAQANVETWFNSAMDRVSGWYRRRSQVIVLVLSCLVAVGANVNSISVAGYLYRNRTARETLVATASAKRDSTRPEQSIGDAMKTLDGLKLPIGWGPSAAPLDVSFDTFLVGAGSVLTLILGWIITALAMSLGAPFWFDMLNRLMVIRSTVKPDEKSHKEASKDPPSRGTRDGPKTD